MKRRQLLGALAVLPLGVRAAESDALLAQVRARLADAPLLRGAFEQRKTVKGFRHPLVSRGDFVVWRERGVVWRTLEPVASTLLVTRDKLVSRQADGQVAMTLDAGKEPALRAVNEALFALLAADLALLSARFEVGGALVGERGWRLQLKPRDKLLAQWVVGVEIEGERQVRSLQWTEVSGDATQVLLSRTLPAPAPTPEEAARFD